MAKKWVFLLAVGLLIFSQAELRAIPKDCCPDVQKFPANEIQPKTVRFVLPNGDSIEVKLHVDKYGFYTETVRS